MTLNISLVTNKKIYQLSDFQFTCGKRPLPKTFQKGVQINLAKYSAVVTFNGAGINGKTDVSQWLANTTRDLPYKSSPKKLLERLTKANSWLMRVEMKSRKHTFCVCVFDQHRPFIALVSNWEYLDNSSKNNILLTKKKNQVGNIFITKMNVEEPTVILGGSGAHHVMREECTALLDSVNHDVEHELIVNNLSDICKRVSLKDKQVSTASFIAHINHIGQGGVRACNLPEDKEYIPPLPLPIELQFNPALDKNGKPKKIRIMEYSSIRSPTSKSEYIHRIKYDPLNPELHSNFGNFLLSKYKDVDGAERAYLNAIEASPNHSIALSNYAVLLWKHRSDIQMAYTYFRKAIAGDNQSCCRNKYIDFLSQTTKKYDEIELLCTMWLKKNPNDINLLKSYALLCYSRLKNYEKSVNLLSRLLIKRPNDQESLVLLAASIAFTKGADSKQIFLYEQSLKLKPTDMVSLINLAQLKFLTKQYSEANDLLNKAISLKPNFDQQVEIWFYRFAHNIDDYSVALQRIIDLISNGARSKYWDLSRNVELAIKNGHRHEKLLRTVADVINEKCEADQLDTHKSDWI